MREETLNKLISSNKSAFCENSFHEISIKSESSGDTPFQLHFIYKCFCSLTLIGSDGINFIKVAGGSVLTGFGDKDISPTLVEILRLDSYFHGNIG